jgi:DNA polymerase III delta prime subunit
LDQIVGNTRTVQALEAHLKKSSPNRSLLFVGPSGCGKTTLAICMAEALGAVDVNGWNFKMLNASDFRGIDTVREVRETAQRNPIGAARARVWLYDECHKLTPDAQEAMLKLLEDPPRNCWFILATTNPEKLKVTLKRRCTEFQVEPVSDRDLTQLIFKICKQEKKKLPPEVIKRICAASMGSPGIALNALDKVIDLQPGEMESAIKNWEKTETNVISLCRALMNSKQWKTFVPILVELEGEDPETIRRQVLEYFRKVLLSGNEKAYLILDSFSTPYYDTGKAGLVISVYEAISQ